MCAALSTTSMPRRWPLVLFLLNFLFTVASAITCQTPNPFAVRLGVLLGDDPDSSCVLNAINMAIADTLVSTSSIYLSTAGDSIAITGIMSDGCYSGTGPTTSANNSVLLAQNNNVSVVIGTSCPEGTAKAQLSLTQRLIPLITYSSLDTSMSTSSASAGTYFLRVSLTEFAGPAALLDYMSQLNLVQFGLFSSDGDFNTFDDQVLALAPSRGMDVVSCGKLQWVNPTANATNVARIDAAILNFMARGIKVIVVYTPLDLARMIGANLFKRGLYGSNFVYVLNQRLQTSVLTSDETGYSVYLGATVLQLAPSAAPLSSETEFVSRYTGQGYQSCKTPGFFGRFGYDAVALIARAINSVRSTDGCGVITTTRLMTAMRAISFSGASGTVAFDSSASNDNNRLVSSSSYRVNNLLSSLSFSQAGSMSESVLTLTTPIVYPGGFTSPPNQYRLGFLLTDTVAAAAAAPSNLANLTATIAASAIINGGFGVSFASIPSQLALYGARLAAAAISGCGISALKLQLQSLNSNIYFSTDNALLGGRDSIVIPSAQTQYDDCGVNPSVAFQAVKNMLINRGVVAIIGSSCGVVVNNLLTGSDPADVTSKVFPLSIPMISYSAFETQLSSTTAYSYFLRTNLPQRNETSILLSVLNEFGWSRVCIVTTDSQMGANAVADIAALLALYGARAEQYLNLNSTILAGGVSSIISNIITPLKANNARVIVLLLDSVALLTGFLQAAQQSQFYGPNIQFVAYHYFDLNFLSASFVPPISSVVSQGLLYTSSTVDTSQAQYTAMMSSWSVSPVTAAYASLTTLPTEVAYAWDAVMLIGTTLAGGTFNGVPMSSVAYTPASFMSALRSTSIAGATGPISYASGSNDRQAQPSFFKINSVQPSTSVPSLASPITIGTTDVGSQFKQTANAPAFGGGSSNPTLACPSGSVGTIISTVSGGQTLKSSQCNPCQAGSYAPDYSPSCLTCPASSATCFYGASTPMNNTFKLLQKPANLFPIQAGSLTDPDTLSAFNAWFLWVSVASTATVLGYGLLVITCPRSWQLSQGNMWSSFDIYYNEHPTESGEKVIKKSNGVGGFFTFLLWYFTVLIGAYLTALYVIDAYNVTQQLQTGTSLLSNPTPMKFQLSYILTDNLASCPLICASAVQGLPGTLTCSADASTSICTVNFVINPAAATLPTAFSFKFVAPATRVHGVYFSVSALNWLGQDYGFSMINQASSGTVFYGVKPMVLNVTMQPFRFDALPLVPASQAPQTCNGYQAVLASYTAPTEMSAAAWDPKTLLGQGPGVPIQINFDRPQSVSYFATVSKQGFLDFFTVWCCLIFTGVNFFISTARNWVEWISLLWRRRRDNKIQKQIDARTQVVEQISVLKAITKGEAKAPPTGTNFDDAEAVVKASQAVAAAEAAIIAESLKKKSDVEEETVIDKSTMTAQELEMVELKRKEEEAEMRKQKFSPLEIERRMKQSRGELIKAMEENLPSSSLQADNDIPTARLLGLFLDQARPVLVTQALIVALMNRGDAFNMILNRLLAMLHRYYLDHGMPFPYTWIAPASSISSLLAPSRAGSRVPSQNPANSQSAYVPDLIQQVRDYEKEVRDAKLAQMRVLRDQRAVNRAVEDAKKQAWLDGKKAQSDSDVRREVQAAREVENARLLATDAAEAAASSAAADKSFVEALTEKVLAVAAGQSDDFPLPPPPPPEDDVPLPPPPPTEPPNFFIPPPPMSMHAGSAPTPAAPLPLYAQMSLPPPPGASNVRESSRKMFRGLTNTPNGAPVFQPPPPLPQVYTPQPVAFDPQMMSQMYPTSFDPNFMASQQYMPVQSEWNPAMMTPMMGQPISDQDMLLWQQQQMLQMQQMQQMQTMQPIDPQSMQAYAGQWNMNAGFGYQPAPSGQPPPQWP